MKYTDLVTESAEALEGLLLEKKKLLFSLRNKLKLMQLTNPNEIREVRRDIARVSMALKRNCNRAGEFNA